MTMKSRSPLGVFLMICLCLVLPGLAFSQSTATFDLDNATPALTNGLNTPFDQTSAGVTAHFSSPSGLAFSIQSDASTGFHLSQFSGHYIYDNNLNANALDISFSRPVTSISLKFATADFQQVEVPTTIQVTAYMNSATNPSVGSATAHGTYVVSDTMPMGTLSFTSAGQPFNLVRISIPFQPLGASDFLVDNIRVVLVRTPYTDEAAYLAAVANLGSTTIQEGFENALVWGSVRSPGTAASVATNGIIWTSNHLNAATASDSISTSAAAARTGSWGLFSQPHGDPDAVLPTAATRDGIIGTRVPGNGLLYGAGGWVSGDAGSHLVMIIDGDELNPMDFGAFGAAWQFFGVTDPNGFSTFELRETNGLVSTPKSLFADDLTLATKAGITSTASVSAASYQFLAPLAPGAVGSTFGLNLAPSAVAATAFPLPTAFGDTTLSITDSAGAERPAPLYYASPTQINFVVPDAAALGAATVSVKALAQVLARGPLAIAAVAPSIFTADMSGSGPPAAYAKITATDGSLTLQSVFTCNLTTGACTTAPIDVAAARNVTLVLFGTGIRGLSALAAVTATIGGVNSPVIGAAPLQGSTGLDEVDVTVPATLAGRGAVDLRLTVDGKVANTVRVSIR
jgi:uncharacterized protein (TIGR03437 family)